MKRYKAFIHGRNLFLTLDRKVERMGFFTMRIVDAATPSHARALVLELVEQELKDIRIDGTNSDWPPKLEIEELEQVDWDPEEPEKTGFSFYVAEDDEC